MSGESEKYLLDPNAFIQAKRRFYGLDFCPGYWGTLIWHHEKDKLRSIDKVRVEILLGGDDLAAWVDERLGKEAFAATSTAEVFTAYTEMLAWVMAQPQFSDAAKFGYQEVADGWLAAYAKANGCVVVTLEEFDPAVKKKVPLPNVCRAFDVEVITPFEMLRRLGVKLTWEPPP